MTSRSLKPALPPSERSAEASVATTYTLINAEIEKAGDLLGDDVMSLPRSLSLRSCSVKSSAVAVELRWPQPRSLLLLLSMQAFSWQARFWARLRRLGTRPGTSASVAHMQRCTLRLWICLILSIPRLARSASPETHFHRPVRRLTAAAGCACRSFYKASEIVSINYPCSQQSLGIE